MKKFLLAGASLLAMGVASASAADLPARMPAKAPAYVAPMAYSWTGFYLGINGGYGFGRGQFNGTVPGGEIDAGGFLFGGTAGYNWQTGPVVFGLEGDIDWSGQRGSGSCGATTCDVRNDYLATIRGRLGYAMDRWMPYITGGAAIGNVKTSIAGAGGGDTNNTKGGWTLGGGVEASIAGPWTAKVEYLHVDLGDADTAVAGTSTSFVTDIIRGGINYKF